MEALNLEIGEMVTWTTGKLVQTGCYLEDTENGMCTVIAHTIAGRPKNAELQVVKSILKRVEE